MILPTIHLNGTSGQTLLASYGDARYQVHLGVIALEHDLEFNQRDYYPQGPESWKQAQAEMAARLQKLRDVEAELLEIQEHILKIEEMRKR